MIKDYFDIFWFIIAFGIGIFFAYISIPLPEIIYKYPTPENSNSTIYIDNASNCYKYMPNKTDCPNDEKKISIIPIQKIDSEDKEKESAISRFQKMIGMQKNDEIVIIPNN
jgi:hypothetical protein